MWYLYYSARAAECLFQSDCTSLFIETFSDSGRKLFAPPWHCSAAASISFYLVLITNMP